MKNKQIKYNFVGILISFILPIFLNAEEKEFKVSDGSVYKDDLKGFSIYPPQSWEIITKNPNLSLLIQKPYYKGIKYQATIQIMVFSEPKYIDETSAKNFGGTIVKKYSTVSNQVENYKIRNYLLTKMKDGTTGILYYTDFLLQGKELMQAHILLSSKKNSYLVTYTDLRENFEGEEYKDNLAVAWNSMMSVEVSGSAPLRINYVLYTSILTFIILLTLLVSKYKRNKRELKVLELGEQGALDLDEDSSFEDVIDEINQENFEEDFSDETSENENESDGWNLSDSKDKKSP